MGFGASDWLSGKNGSKENDKLILNYSDDEWDFIWATMIENGAWAVPAIKDDMGNLVKENLAPELFIKYVAHDLHSNIIVIDLFNNTVQICSGNQLLNNNLEFESPLIIYTTGSHFQSVLPKDHEFFVQYAKKLLTNYPIDTTSDFQAGNLSNRFKDTKSNENVPKKRKPSDMETSKAKNQKQEKVTDVPEKNKLPI
jgi:hypothetical protein